MDISLKCSYSNRTDIYIGTIFSGYLKLTEKLTYGKNGRLISRKRVSMENQLPKHPMPILFRR